VTEWSYPFYADADGVVSADNMDRNTGDQPHAVADRPAPEVDFETQLADAIKTQKNRVMVAVSPIAEDRWVCLEGGSAYAVRFIIRSQKQYRNHGDHPAGRSRSSRGADRRFERCPAVRSFASAN